MKIATFCLAFVLTWGYNYHLHDEEFKDRGRIVNGYNAEKEKFKYMVELHVTFDKYETLCGGALIGRGWVLTAAHCVHKMKGISVYLGSIYIDDGDVGYFYALAITYHPNFNIKKLSHDIALIKIPDTRACDSISIVKLPKIQATYPTYAGEYGIVSGWGKTGENGYISDRLKWIRMPILSNEVCRDRVGWFHAENLCVDTSSGHSACDGDSGGPLILESTGELIGVLSSISKAGCESGVPNRYVRVTYYLEWIKAVTGIAY